MTMNSVSCNSGSLRISKEDESIYENIYIKEKKVKLENNNI